MSDVQATINDRQGKYGDYKTTAQASQEIKHVIYKWLSQKPAMPPAEIRESLDNIALKIARVITGDPLLPDNFHDIEGYAKLAEKVCIEAKLYDKPMCATEITERLKEQGLLVGGGGGNSYEPTKPVIVPSDKAVEVKPADYEDSVPAAAKSFV